MRACVRVVKQFIWRANMRLSERARVITKNHYFIIPTYVEFGVRWIFWCEHFWVVSRCEAWECFCCVLESVALSKYYCNSFSVAPSHGLPNEKSNSFEIYTNIHFSGTIILCHMMKLMKFILYDLSNKISKLHFNFQTYWQNKPTNMTCYIWYLLPMKLTSIWFINLNFLRWTSKH